MKTYLNTNSNGKRIYADCQLVTAVNAYHYLTGKSIKQNSKRYKKLAELCGCIAGSCMNIKKAWKDLGIKERKKFQSYDIKKYLKKGCFIELTVHQKNYGYHSIAIVDYVKKADCVRITNFNHVTSMDGWMFLEDLKPFIVNNPNKEKWQCRTFKLR